MIAVPIAMMVVGAAISAQQASERNKAIKKSQMANIAATAENQKQVADAGEVQALKRRNEAAMIRARLRVAGASAGVGDGTDALLAQANYDEALNLNILHNNVINEQRRLASGLTADLTSLQSGMVNGVLAGMQGGIQGYGTGMQISGGMGNGAGSGANSSANSGDAYVANSRSAFA